MFSKSQEFNHSVVDLRTPTPCALEGAYIPAL